MFGLSVELTSSTHWHTSLGAAAVIFHRELYCGMNFMSLRYIPPGCSNHSAADCVCVRAWARARACWNKTSFCSPCLCNYFFLHVWSLQNMRLGCENDGNLSILSGLRNLRTPISTPSRSRSISDSFPLLDPVVAPDVGQWRLKSERVAGQPSPCCVQSQSAAAAYWLYYLHDI